MLFIRHKTQNYLTTAITSSDAGTFFEISNNRIGGKYKKVRYVEYTDDKFTKLKERTEQEQHLGILGKIGTFIILFKLGLSM